MEPRALTALAGLALVLASCETTPPREIPDPFCRERPRIPFCEDFDETPLPGVFDATHIESASLSADMLDSASGQSSLLAAVNGEGRASVSRRFEQGFKYRVFLQMRIDTVPSEGDAELVALDLDADGVPSYRVALGASAEGFWVLEDRDGERTMLPTNAPLPLGHWVSVRLDYEVLESGEARLHVRFGNDSVLDVLRAPPAAEAVPTVEIGVIATSGAWSARFDNVTFDLN